MVQKYNLRSIVCFLRLNIPHIAWFNVQQKKMETQSAEDSSGFPIGYGSPLHNIAKT